MEEFKTDTCLKMNPRIRADDLIISEEIEQVNLLFEATVGQLFGNYKNGNFSSLLGDIINFFHFVRQMDIYIPVLLPEYNFASFFCEIFSQLDLAYLYTDALRVLNFLVCTHGFDSRELKTVSFFDIVENNIMPNLKNPSTCFELIANIIANDPNGRDVYFQSSAFEHSIQMFLSSDDFALKKAITICIHNGIATEPFPCLDDIIPLHDFLNQVLEDITIDPSISLWILWDIIKMNTDSTLSFLESFDRGLLFSIEVEISLDTAMLLFEIIIWFLSNKDNKMYSVFTWIPLINTAKFFGDENLNELFCIIATEATDDRRNISNAFKCDVVNFIIFISANSSYTIRASAMSFLSAIIRAGNINDISRLLQTGYLSLAAKFLDSESIELRPAVIKSLGMLGLVLMSDRLDIDYDFISNNEMCNAILGLKEEDLTEEDKGLILLYLQGCKKLEEDHSSEF